MKIIEVSENKRRKFFLEIMEDIKEKFESFGFNVIEVNGHDIDALINNAKGQTSDAIQDPSQVLDQQTINDLFDDDQWQ